MNQKKHTRQTIKYFWSHLKKYPIAFSTIIVGVTVAVIFDSILSPILFSKIIDLISGFEGEDKAEIFDELMKLLWMLVGTGIIGSIGWRTAGFCGSHAYSGAMKNIATDCFQNIQQKSLTFFSNNFIGSLVTKTKRLIYGFERIMDLIYWEFLTTLLEYIFYVTILFHIAPQFAWIMIIWSVIFMAITSKFSLWKMKYDREFAETDSSVTAAYADSLTNFFNVKIFARFKHEKERFGVVAEKQRKIRKFNWTLNEWYEIFQVVSMIILALTITYFSIKLWIAGELSVGTVVLVNTYLLQFMRKLWNFGRQVRDMVTAFADCEEMVDILYTEPDILDPKDPKPCRITKGHIKIKDLLFRYESNAPVFKNFNLDIQPGEKVGLVGESGSGKSTLTKILFRFNDINKGFVTIDGQDITKVGQEDLRQKIAFVPQESILFHRSLEENIRYGDLEATTEEVIEAAKKAHAHEFILNTKDGYNTLVGERGIKLSGGEKQRIAIARAMLKKAPILILDEATSALDSVAETHIQEALEELMKGCTTIVIAHRLSTLRKMDRIIVLDKGKIVEQGSHKELVEKDGKYNELWSHQVGGFIQE